MSKLNLEILAYEEGPLGLLCLRQREVLSQPGTIVTEMTLNHEFLMSSLYTDSERALSEIALELHSGSQLEVLVGGLGLGYTAYEALRSDRVTRLEVLELLPQVIDWLARGLVPLAEELLPTRVHRRRLRATLALAVDRVAVDRALAVNRAPDVLPSGIVLGALAAA